MAKWSMGATDAYVEAMRRRYERPVITADAGSHEAAVAAEIERVETQRPAVLFEHDADEPERLRRVFATWDFRNGT